MANSYVEIPVTGVDSYTFPFPYIEQSHINVYAGGVLQTQGVHYTFTDSNTIEFSVGNVPTDTNTVILIQRVTDASGRLVTYSNTGLDADDLNLGSKQNFFLAQEAKDAASLNVTKGLDGLTSVNGRLTNVTDPVDSQDAATKAYVASQLTQSVTGGVYIQDREPSYTGLNEGDLWVDTDTNIMYVWTSTGWANGGTVESETFHYTGADLVPFGLFYIIPSFALGIANIDQVFLNGIFLKECTTSLDFTTGDWDRSSSVVTFNSALAADDVITITTTTRMSEVLSNAVLNINSNMDSVLSATQNALDAETAQGLSEDARDDSVVAQGLSENARDASVVAQGLSEDARDDAISAKDVIVNGDYLQHKTNSVILEAVDQLSLLGGIGTNYIYSKRQFDPTTITSTVVVSYTDDDINLRKPVTFDKELILTSPDGNTTKPLSINNAGQLVFDGTVIS